MDGALSSGRYNREKDHGKINKQRNETRPDGGTKDRQRHTIVSAAHHHPGP